MIRIEQPTLLLNRQRAIRNIERMADKARRSNVRFRPHFKTHQAAQIGAWFRELGTECITVSSVEMATYFADDGWSDITIAFPANVLEIDKINALARKIQLGLLVESVETTNFLVQQLEAKVNIWIKIDVGYQRTGIPWHKIDDFIALARAIDGSDNLSLTGLLTHSGHSYHVQGKAAIAAVYKETVERMQGVREALQAEGFAPLELSIGDTPCCSVVQDLSEVDEIRAGNFVFYDVKQLSIEACNEQDIAVGVACPVVAKHAERKETVIYGGAVHLSKDYNLRADGKQSFGRLALPTEVGWGPLLPDVYVASVSQEHGVVRVEDDRIFNAIQVGDVLVVLPIHSCLTVNLLKRYLPLDGETILMMGAAG